MTIHYRQFIDSLAEGSRHSVQFYLPKGEQIPAHFHITDVGAVFRHFIDCGGKTREEAYLQIQLWLGKDRDHRLNGEAILKILKQSGAVLDRLPDLQNSEVVIEYKDDLTSQYHISGIEATDKAIQFYLNGVETRCLAALRHEQEKADDDACCKRQCACS